MHKEIERLVTEFSRGKMSRRQLIAALGTLVMVAGASRVALADVAPEEDEPGSESLFQAVGLDHIALRVTDVPRARDFYVKHLGLEVTRDGGESSCFLSFDRGFLALFRGEEAIMDHYCYAVRDYDVDVARERLTEAGFSPRVQGNRIYFNDSEGHVVQLAAGG